MEKQSIFSLLVGVVLTASGIRHRDGTLAGTEEATDGALSGGEILETSASVQTIDFIWWVRRDSNLNQTVMSERTKVRFVDWYGGRGLVWTRVKGHAPMAPCGSGRTDTL